MVKRLNITVHALESKSNREPTCRRVRFIQWQTRAIFPSALTLLYEVLLFELAPSSFVIITAGAEVVATMQLWLILDRRRIVEL